MPASLFDPETGEAGARRQSGHDLEKGPDTVRQSTDPDRLHASKRPDNMAWSGNPEESEGQGYTRIACSDKGPSNGSMN